jgi:3-mercaptopyruvate sulfurtransferase SseA
MSESDYAKDVLVSADWVEEHFNEFQSDDPAHRLVEVDVDTEAYDEAHAPAQSASTGRRNCKTRPRETPSRRTTLRT